MGGGLVGPIAEWTLRAGWRLQRDATDVVRSALGGEADLARRASRLLLTTAEESAAGAALLCGDDEASGAWRELRNKVEAFRAFEHVDALLGTTVGACDLAALVGRAATLAPPLSVWAAEGVGYHGTAAWCRGRGESPSLGVRADDGLPSAALVPLHAGMGAAIAAHALEHVRARAGGGTLEDALRWFEEACGANADAGHRLVALEGLGFVARGMYGDLWTHLERGVREARPVLRSLVWHGAGRAMYFSPTSALPLAATRRRVLQEVLAAGDTEGDGVNAVAGFAWAATLVNLRDPDVLEDFAAEAVRLGIERSFARGVHDALAIWRRCAPGDEATLAAFERHRPRDPSRADSWACLLAAASPRRVPQPGDLFHVAA